jgi:hypothetical protein
VKDVFDQLLPVERERLMALRKAHKEVVVFLHEWGHTLGLIHAARDARVMNPSYHHLQSALSDTEARMVEIVLRARTDEEARGELRALLQREPDPDWDPRDRDRLRALVDPGRRVPPPRATAPRPMVPAPIVQLLEQAEAEASHQQEPEAEARLRAIEAQLTGPHAASPAWERVAALWAKLGAPTFAVAAALRRDRYGAEAMKAWAIGARRRSAIPPDASARGLPPEREGTYARAVESALRAIDEARRADAERQAAFLEREFAALPAPVIVRCGLLLGSPSPARARAPCEEALRRQDDAIPALRFMVQLAGKLHDKRLAETHRARLADLE